MKAKKKELSQNNGTLAKTQKAEIIEHPIDIYFALYYPSHILQGELPNAS
jgi:hypothetical protein